MTTHHGPSEFAQPTEKIDLRPIFDKLLDHQTLTTDETGRAFEALMSGGAHEAEIGALLGLLATRVPTADELLGAARVMRAHVDAVPTSIDLDRLVDTAGTGGAPKTFNVSTVAAVIAAAAGEGKIAVAKHGNRSRTGRGSAEVLAKLGVNVDAAPEAQAACLDECNLCFCFAIHHHPATRHVIGARKALGFATIFNLLGPLTNPAGAKRQVMGVYADKFVRPIAEALCDLGATRAMVVHSRDGLDELTVTAPTHIAHVENGGVREEEITPESVGLPIAVLDELQVDNLDDAVRVFRRIIDGTETGPKRDIALLSTAATLVVGGCVTSLVEGVEVARQTVINGRAGATLQKLVQISNENR